MEMGQGEHSPPPPPAPRRASCSGDLHAKPLGGRTWGQPGAGDPCHERMNLKETFFGAGSLSQPSPGVYRQGSGGEGVSESLLAVQGA